MGTNFKSKVIAIDQDLVQRITKEVQSFATMADGLITGIITDHKIQISSTLWAAMMAGNKTSAVTQITNDLDAKYKGIKQPRILESMIKNDIDQLAEKLISAASTLTNKAIRRELFYMNTFGFNFSLIQSIEVNDGHLTVNQNAHQELTERLTATIDTPEKGKAYEILLEASRALNEVQKILIEHNFNPLNFDSDCFLIDENGSFGVNAFLLKYIK